MNWMRTKKRDSFVALEHVFAQFVEEFRMEIKALK